MFSIMHIDGSGDVDPPIAAIHALFDELKDADTEHGDVTVRHTESGWFLSAHRDGRLVLENLEDGHGPGRHMIPVERERVLFLWRQLIAGDLDAVMSEPWRPGYR